MKAETPKWRETVVGEPGLASLGLVWWRPNGVIGEKPELDKAMLRID